MAILNLKLITPPSVEPVTLDRVKKHMRVTISDDDDLIGVYISAARELCERETHRSFFNQTWQLSLDHFPLFPFWNGTARSTSLHDSWYYSTLWKAFQIKLPRPGLVSVSSVTYLDTAGNLQTIDPSTYKVDAAGEPGSVVPAYGNCWPYTDMYLPNSVQVTYVAGTYGDGTTVNNCPAKVQVATMLVAADLYENRTDTGDLKSYSLGYVARLLESECLTVFGYENN